MIPNTARKRVWCNKESIKVNMQLFYSEEITGDIAILEGDELQHCIKTLRKKTGDEIELMDGKGNYYLAVLKEITKKNATLQLLKKEVRPLPWEFHIHIAIAPTKNIDRIEWFVEKAVEIGINEITPILCRYSERKQLRLDRLEKIALAAAKQSHKFTRTALNELIDFQKFIREQKADKKFIAHCYNDNLPPLFQSCTPLKGEHILVLIGPEGDFSEEEVKYATDNGFQAISLGKSRLRTETAGLVACHSLQLNHK